MRRELQAHHLFEKGNVIPHAQSSAGGELKIDLLQITLISAQLTEFFNASENLARL